MLSMRRLNIKTKLTAIIMIASTVSVLLAGIIFIGYSLYTRSEDLAQELMGLAEVIGHNSQVILEFNFPEDADKVLSSLRAKQSIVFARIYNADGNVFSSYGNLATKDIITPIQTKEDYHLFENYALHVFYHVRVNDQISGTVYLQDDMRNVYDHTIHDVIALLTIMIITLIISYFVSSRLQRLISGPILSLSDIAKTVSEKKDYSLRVQKISDDEIGQLIDSFNSMLQQIQIQHEDLLESEERFKLALKGANLGTWDWNIPTGHVIFSKRWINMLGYSVNEIAPNFNSWKELLHPDDEPRVMAALKDNLEGKTAHYETEFRLRTKEGEWKWILARGKVFGRDAQGAPLRSVGTHLDITELKQAELDRQKMASQLLQSQKMESIGTLAGGIAHDFNNILSIILGNAELAHDDLPNGYPAGNRIDELITAGLRAKDLVRQLLNFSRKSDHKPIPLKLNSIIRDCLKLIRATIPATIEVQQSISDEPCVVMSDPTQIHQVMMNICTNAAQAMLGERGILNVGLTSIESSSYDNPCLIELKQGPYAKITISDTGIGIPKENQDRIFDPYFTTKEVGKGSGIGLSVVHGIIKSNDGAIWVDSEQGKGTTFNVVLPLIIGESIPEKTDDQSTPQGRERILFVDDEESIVDMTGKLLERLGYTVTGKTNSLEALETFRSQPDDFDLIISDMAMPKMAGDQLVQKIQQIKPGIPTILCTGYSDQMTDEKAKAMGISALVLKPIVRSQFARIIRNIIDGK